MTSKKPPDDYKCLKNKLIKIINNDIYNNKNVFDTINNAIDRTNKIVIKTYMLLRLWLLDKYNKN